MSVPYNKEKKFITLYHHILVTDHIKSHILMKNEAIDHSENFCEKNHEFFVKMILSLSKIKNSMYISL
jgi:hypothetical protein